MAATLLRRWLPSIFAPDPIRRTEANRSSFRSKNDQDNTTGLAAGKGSSAIEYKADTPMTLKKTTANDGSTVVQCTVVKNREGPKEPTFAVRCTGTRFEEESGYAAPTPVDDASRIIAVMPCSVPRTADCPDVRALERAERPTVPRGLERSVLAANQGHAEAAASAFQKARADYQRAGEPEAKPQVDQVEAQAMV
jgi:hypothetical protein